MLVEHFRRPTPAFVRQQRDRRYRLSFLSGKAAVRRELQGLMNWLRSQCLRGDDLGKIELVLAELLNNVVEHGYGARPGGRIDLQLDLQPRQLVLKLRDRGRALPAAVLRDDHRPQAPQALPEGGWGWHLIHQLSRGIYYARQSGENQLRLKIPLSG